MHCAVLPAPTQIDSTKGGCVFALSVCALAAHRIARAMTPTTISNAAKAKVSASRKSVWTSDLYIVSPSIGRNPTSARVREAKSFIEAQTRQHWQFAWANSRHICDRHNCASDCEPRITLHQGVSVKWITQRVFDLNFDPLHYCGAAQRVTAWPPEVRD